MVAVDDQIVKCFLPQKLYTETTKTYIQFGGMQYLFLFNIINAKTLMFRYFLLFHITTPKPKAENEDSFTGFCWL